MPVHRRVREQPTRLPGRTRAEGRAESRAEGRAEGRADVRTDVRADVLGEARSATRRAKRKISDVVADRIRQHIVDEGLRPGDRLPTEHDFAARFGVSRLAVREATKALGFLGVVTASPRRGLAVGELQLERVTPFLQFHSSFRSATAAQLIDTRIVLETGGLPHVVRRMRDDPTLAEQLVELANRFRAARDVATWIQLDIAFHRALLEASGLAPLVAFNDLLELFFRRFRDSVQRAEWKQGIASHLQIVEALRRGRLTSACELVRNHIESHRDRLGIPS